MVCIFFLWCVCVCVCLLVEGRREGFGGFVVCVDCEWSSEGLCGEDRWEAVSCSIHQWYVVYP